MNIQNKEYTNKSIVKYLLIAFGIAWTIQGIIIYFYDKMPKIYSLAMLQILGAVMMLAPMIAVIITLGSIKEKISGISWKLHFRKNWKWFLASWFIPIVITGIGVLLYFAIFPSDFDPNCGYLHNYLGGISENDIGIPINTLAVLYIIGGIIMTPINVFFAVGEEAGWRGFLTPALQSKFGRIKGLIISGIIWGMWHWPLIIGIGYEYGTGYWGAPYSGIIAFCIVAVAFSIIFTYIYEKTNSIWIPALGHGAFNAVAGAGLYFTSLKGYLLGPATSGLVTDIPLFILAILCIISYKKVMQKNS